jgi:hypothetical protein
MFLQKPDKKGAKKEQRPDKDNRQKGRDKSIAVTFRAAAGLHSVLLAFCNVCTVCVFGPVSALVPCLAHYAGTLQRHQD